MRIVKDFFKSVLHLFILMALVCGTWFAMDAESAGTAFTSLYQHGMTIFVEGTYSGPVNSLGPNNSTSSVTNAGIAFGTNGTHPFIALRNSMPYRNSSGQWNPTTGQWYFFTVNGSNELNYTGYNATTMGLHNSSVTNAIGYSFIVPWK